MKNFFSFLICLMLAIISLILYARFVGTMGFITKEYTLYSENISPLFDGIKIVHFSDIHYGRAINSSKINDIVDEINLINPDIVVFTGDLVDKDGNLVNDDYQFLTDAFSRINAKYGKYSVLGNHDYKNMDEIIKIFNNSSFKYLENSYDIIYNQNNEKIFIGGIGNVSYDLDNLEKTMEYFDKEENNADYKILLVHEPDISDDIVSDYDVDLILAGHSHNGQIRLPVVGALHTPVHAKKYYDEYYEIDKTKLYISSGVGVSRINYRLFNRPSINFYRINKKNGNL